MTLLASSIILGLAWFATINIVASGGVWLVARALHYRAIRPRAGVWLTLRLAPATMSTLFVAGLFLPAHWRYELPGTRESFGLVLYSLVTLSLLLVVRSTRRVVTAVGSNRSIGVCRPERAARGGSRTIEVDGLGVLSLAGIFQTTIIIGKSVRDVLTAGELDVALAHEMAHRRAWDNLKRFAMFCAPDLFGYTSTCRKLEDVWRAEAECLADARAVQGDPTRALDLASALVKVARLPGSSPLLNAPTWTAFYEEPLIETRVRRLVGGSCQAAGGGLCEPSLAATLIAAIGSVIWLASVPHQLYRVTEALVRLLP